MPGGKRSENQHSNFPPTGSGLVKAVYDTGRGRGASATPAPMDLSPQATRRVPRQLENMSSFYNQNSNNQSPDRTPNSHLRSGSSSQQSSPHHRQSSVSTHQSRPSQTSSSQYGGSQQQGTNVSPNTSATTVADVSRYLQESLDSLVQRVRTTAGLASNVQDAIIDDCRSISQEYNQKQRLLQRQFDLLNNDKNELTVQLERAHRKIRELEAQLNTVNIDHTKALRERSSFQARVAELEKKAEQQEKQWASIDLKRQNMMNEQQNLVAQLQRKMASQDEQLSSKRALWLDQNPESSPRRDGMQKLQDPFASSPTPSSHAGYTSASARSHTEFSQGSKQPHITSHVGVPTGPSNRAGSNLVRRGALPLPTTRPQQAPQVPVLPGGFLSSKISPTERGAQPRHPAESFFPAGNRPLAPPFPAHSVGKTATYNPRSQQITPSVEPSTSGGTGSSTALAMRSANGDGSDEWAAYFGTLYGLIEGWTRSYANQPNLVNDQNIANKNQALWEFMMNCTYPGRAQDSHSHVMLLLNDFNTRRWFVMRMCVTYCVQEILDYSAYRGYSNSTDRKLKEIKEGLQARGFSLERRQMIVDQKVQVIKSIIDAEDYQAYRTHQIGNHTKALRDRLGPMLNDKVDRTAAGKDLGAIARKAWDLSGKMHSSGLTFQIIFPETAAKFNASSMIAKDQPAGRSMELQLRQSRLKLVITPVVTMRDDRSTTIIAKNIHQSTVLTMG